MNKTKKYKVLLAGVLVISELLFIGCSEDDTSKNNEATTPSNRDTEAVNNAPIVNAGADKTAILNTPLSLVGTATDSDGSISSIAWKKGSEVLGTTLSFSYIPTTIGTDVLTLVAVDDDGKSASDEVKVVVGSASTEEVINMGLEYMRTHKNNKLKSTDCNAYKFGETVSLVWVGNTLQTPESDLKGWGDISKALQYTLAPADNMMKSIYACNDVIKLTEYGNLSFSKAVESVVRSRTKESSPFSDVWDSTASTLPTLTVDEVTNAQDNANNTSTENHGTLTIEKCKSKYGNYSNSQWASSQSSGENKGEATACYQAIVVAPSMGIDGQLYIDAYNNGTYDVIPDN